jgi:hypothetical protein
VLRPELFMGVVSAVSASHARMTLSSGGAPSASHFETQRYGRGEVGEFVLIEGQLTLVLARLVEVTLPETDRKVFSLDYPVKQPYDVLGALQFLGTVRCDNLRVAPGVANYPRIGDRVYAAPHTFVGQIPTLQEISTAATDHLTLNLGSVRGAGDAAVEVRPEKLLGRHCAVLGATGGGKSWTVARILQEVTKYNAKVLLLDATGEYRTLSASTTTHLHLGQPVDRADTSQPCCLPPHDFQESDFIALFEPSGKVQGPKLRDAIRSLRLIRVQAQLANSEGYLRKQGAPKADIQKAFATHSASVEDPTTPFDVRMLPKQLMAECVFADGGTFNNPDPKFWGSVNQSDVTFCLPLATRIQAILSSAAFSPVFGSDEHPFAERFAAFLSDANARVMRVCLGGVSYEYRAREFIVNAIGRAVLNEARKGAFRKRPILVILDEAHNFLGRSIGFEDAKVNLDAFELVAREGRKYGLNICLATQRPRDLTEGVLSQIGTLIVHRLTNDRDREIVERACGEIDRSASAFLASLRSGEAAIIGVDFPIPLTVQIHRPTTPPASDGPDYQTAWQVPAGVPAPTADATDSDTPATP